MATAFIMFGTLNNVFLWMYALIPGKWQDSLAVLTGNTQLLKNILLISSFSYY